jgi:diguanylate cyclase (GGDEF)-like protein/PAS domain S-box-containing protein
MPHLWMNDYNPRARAYWWITACLGTGAFLCAAVSVALANATLLQVLAGVAVVAFTGFFPVRIPGAKTSIAGGEIFIFLILLLYGAPAATLAAALEALVGSWKTSKRWTSRIASPAMASIAMLTCGSAFSAGIELLCGNHGFDNAALFGNLALFAVAYFAANTLLATSLIAFKRNEGIVLGRWLRDYGWVGVAYAACASISGLLFLSFRNFGMTVLFAAVPIIGMFLSTLHLYFRQGELNDRARRTEAAEREAALAAHHLQEMRDSESRFHSAFTHSAIGMALVSTEGKLLQANAALCVMLGFSESELLSADIGALTQPDDAEKLKRDLGHLVDGVISTVHMELRGRHKQDFDVWLSLNVSFFQDWNSRSRCLIFQVQDITHRRRAEAQLYHAAYHDTLTELPNRSHFNEQLRRAIAVVQHHPTRIFAVLFLDCDRFKVVNDSLGHKKGDELLVNVARRLQANLRPTDLIARLGGDEFAILVEDVRRETEVIELAERLQSSLRAPVRLGNTEVTTSVSIGITLSSIGYDDPEEILRDADIAMYKAKSQGRAQHALFDLTLHDKVSEQLRLEGELRRAVEQGQLRLFYQPLYSLKTRRLKGFEALVRWQHPERGLLSPGAFVPLAEETGLIVALGNWVLQEACRQLCEWESASGIVGALEMNVNVCGMQLAQSNFVGQVARVLRTTGAGPDQVNLEITESMLMENMVSAVPTLNRLRELGVKLSIDDFGTGYSSLSHLHSLPIDTLKIDRSFVQRLTDNEQGAEIVRTIVTLGKALGKQVLAEGIETEAQLRRLQELECELGQGYLFAKPLPAHEAEKIVGQQRLRSVATLTRAVQ